MSLTTGKSKVILSVSVYDEDGNKEPVTQVNTWPNLSYERLVYIESHLLHALIAMGEDSLEILAKKAEELKGKK